MLAGQPLIVLARREGAGLHDEILAGCRQAGITPRIVHTPSLISTVLRYVEAGTGLGIVTESITDHGSSPARVNIPLTPALTVPLVLVWKEGRDEPPVTAFRRLLTAWAKSEKLFEREPAV